MKRAILIPITLLGLLAAAPALAQAPGIEAYGDDYQSGDFGRILFEDNGVTILRGHDADARDRGTVNAPIFPGDTLRTDANQRVEVELAGGTLVRLDEGGELTFLSLPSPSAQYRDNIVLQLAEGTIRIASRLDDGEEFRIDTPASSVYLLGDGDFRIEAEPRGRTLVLSRRGVAELSAEGGSVLVRAGMMSEAIPGGVPESARTFNTFSSDRFDRWVRERDEALKIRDDYYGDAGYADEGYGDDAAYDEIPEEVQPYYGELSRNGRWVYVDDYGYGWYPTAVKSGWRPYYYGYWAYGPGGYFWVSNEPWGWAPYHYGRWHHVSGYGWTWFPGRVFAGAWVSWSWGSAYVGWAPLDYYGYPAHYTTLRPGFYDPLCWVFVDYHHVYHHNRYYGYHHYYRHGGHHGGYYDHYDSGRDAIVTRAPKVSPRELNDDPDARTRAYRTARGDRGAQFDSLDGRDRRTARRTVDIEDRLSDRAERRVTRRGGRAAGAAEGSPGVRPERAGGPRATRGGDLADRIDDRRRGPGVVDGNPSRRGPRQPRRIEADGPGAGGRDRSGTTTTRGAAPRNGRTDTRFGGSTARREGGNRTSTGAAPATPRRGGISRVHPRRESPDRETPSRRVAGPERTQDGRRELYRNVSRPREARERTSRDATSRGGQRSGRDVAPQRPTSPQRSASPPPARRDTSSRTVTPRPSSRGGSGSRPAATPRSSSRAGSGSRPGVTPRSSSRSGSRPSATPRSSSRGSRSGASAAPKRSGSSGGSKSKASGARSSSRGSGSKSKSKSKSSSSRKGGSSRRR
jgi:hypothetical protein